MKFRVKAKSVAQNPVCNAIILEPSGKIHIENGNETPGDYEMYRTKTNLKIL